MILRLLLGAALATIAATDAPAPLEISTCELGVVHPWTQARCTLTLTNVGSHPLQVVKVQRAHPGVAVNGLPATVAPGDTSTIPVTVDVGSRLGRVKELATFETRVGASAVVAQASFTLSGFSYSILDRSSSKIDFGVVDAGYEAPHTISIMSSDVVGLKVEDILSQPDFTTASLSHDGQSISVAVKPDAPWGLVSGDVILELNNGRQPRVHVPVTADVHGRVIPSDNPYALGVLRTNAQNQVAVRLTSRDAKAFMVDQVKFERLQATWRIQPCIPDSIGCKLLLVTLDKKQSRGFVAGLAHVHILPDDKTLTVGFEGLLLSPDTKIHSLDSGQKEAQAGAKSRVKDAPVDFSRALKKTTAPPVLPPSDPPGHGPVLRWSVANEQPLYGYLIYRAEHKDGPWQRVNGKIIPVLGHDDSASQYAWRDTSAEKGKTYWYFIKTLANNGAKTKLTTPHKVLAH